MRAFRLAAAMLGPMALLAPTVLAQDAKPEAAAAQPAPPPAPWPSQTIRIVTAVTAGSQSDILARAMTEHLAKKPRECLEYIVVHEMTHLLEPTHNARFIALMDQFMPRWQLHRDALNRLPVRHQDWNY